MGNRAFITGVQLGMLVSIREPKARQQLVDDILKNQFICNLENNQMKDFEKEIDLLGHTFMQDKDETELEEAEGENEN
jgi:hypothetical protein